MYVIEHKETGFKHYLDTKAAARFIIKNGSKKYEVKHIEKFDLEDFLYMMLTIILTISMALLWLYFGAEQI